MGTIKFSSKFRMEVVVLGAVGWLWSIRPLRNARPLPSQWDSVPACIPAYIPEAQDASVFRSLA